jgi:mono/diheme cytochrome c family protein
LRWLSEHPKQILWLGLMLLLGLDLGRSIYARLGYRRPATPYSGAPFDSDFPWPPGSGIASTSSSGERLYGRFCASCHGLTGNGLGPAASNMTPRPRDFRLASFKYQTTPRGVAPSDEDLERIISQGLQASAMPRFDDLLRPQEIHEVAEYVKTFAAARYRAPRTPMIVPAEPTPTPQRIADGAALYQAHCAVCHGPEGRGVGTRTTPQQQTWGPRDLSAPWTFRATASTADLWLRMTLGIELGGMPAATQLADDERWKIAQYVFTLARPAPWQPGGVLSGLGQQSDPTARGEYLVKTLTCTYCHTESVVPMNYNPDRFLAGGSATRAYPDGTVVSPNITPDVKTGIGAWNERQIVTALTEGRTPTRSLDLSFKQWFFYQFDPQDAQAIARFLQRVPPKQHRTAPPLRYGVLETAVSKLLRLPLITPRELKIPVPTGPFAEPSPGLLPYDWPQQLLCLLQLVTIALLASALTLIAWWRHQRGATLLTRRVVRTVLLVSATTLLLGALYKHYVLIPRAAMNRFMDEALWKPRASSQASQALLDRGRYLYRVSCMFCHQVDGAGGDRLSDPYAGGFTVRNISSHQSLGIGGFTDQQLARVIRSGIAPDGQQIFWGFMPWDMFSNFDESDLRALMAYLRTLPPVSKQAAPREPPRADHPPEITWTIDMSRILARIRAELPGKKTQ